MSRLFFVAVFSLGFLAFPSPLLAESHKLIHSYRAGYDVYVSQSIEGEYGLLNFTESGQSLEDGTPENWRGYGFRNGVGLELLKFIQMGVSHSFVNLRSKATRLKSLSGSRISGDLKLTFASPLGNLEVSGGPTISRLDYQNGELLQDFVGNGYHYSLGVNYFLSSRFSLCAYGRTFKESLVRSGGDEAFEGASSLTRGLSLGAKIWL